MDLKGTLSKAKKLMVNLVNKLTGSEGPTNSLNDTGALGALISIARHGPQHSSSTIL